MHQTAAIPPDLQCVIDACPVLPAAVRQGLLAIIDTVGQDRVHRLWKRGRMQVPEKQRTRRRLPGHSGHGYVRYRTAGRNHVWSYDLLTERTEDSRQLKILAVLDEFTRECLFLEVGR